MTWQIALVGAHWGLEEALLQRAFVGATGAVLNKLLIDAGLLPSREPPSAWVEGSELADERDRHIALTTNVFNEAPPRGKELWRWGEAKKAVALRYRGGKDKETGAEMPAERAALQARWPDFPWPERYEWPSLTQQPTTFLAPERLGVLPELKARLEASGVKLAVALGGTALWALCGQNGISKARGAPIPSTLVPGLLVLPTFHPSAVAQQWELRPTALADLKKARQLLDGHFTGYSERRLLINPTLAECREWLDGHVHSQPAAPVAIDIETSVGRHFAGTESQQILCVGFGVGCDALCVPFRPPGLSHSYWSTAAEELEALALVRAACQSPNPKVFHNALFDLSWLWKVFGIASKGDIEDTMVMHHALAIEARKGLADLVRLYLHFPQWKDLKHQAGLTGEEGKAEAEG